MEKGHVANPHIPLPTDDNVWNIVGDRKEPKWCERKILPPKAADILKQAQNDSGDTSGSESEHENSSENEDISSSDADSD